MAVEVILVLLFAPVVILCVSWYVCYKNICRYVGRFARPPTYPIIGCALSLSSPKKVIQCMDYQFNSQNAKTLHLNVGFRDGILSKDYKLAEFILSSNSIINKATEYRYYQPWLGTGLFLSGGNKWRQRRKIITPSFHFNILEQFVDVFEKESNVLIEKLINEVGKRSTDIYPLIIMCTLDITCQTAMGVSVNAQNSPNSLYADSVKLMGEIALARALNPLFHFDCLYRFSSLYRKQEKALKILHGFTDSVIAKKRKDMNGNVVEIQVDENTGKKKRMAFLDTILVATVNGQLLSDADIREEVDTFMFGGHDTSSSAISCILYCLSNHPDVQEKVYDELISIYDDDLDRPTTHKDLMQMKYLEMVTKETLRIYPLVICVCRQTTEEVKIGDLTIPKDFSVGVYIHGIHRDPEFYPNPDVFDPERFRDNSSRRLPYAYIPFSAGPRNCIGQKYGMLVIKTIISKILRNFIIKPTVPAHEMVVVGGISVLKPDNGVLMRFVPRTT